MITLVTRVTLTMYFDIVMPLVLMELEMENFLLEIHRQSRLISNIGVNTAVRAKFKEKNGGASSSTRN